MLISYDREKLQKAINHFYSLTGISIAVYDTYFKPLAVAKSSQPNSFCAMIQSTPEGMSRCIRSDHMLLKECMERQCSVTHCCHAGLTDTAVPIISNNNTLLGFILFGQVGDIGDDSPHFSEIYEKVKDMDLKWPNLETAYKELTFFDSQKIDSAAQVVSMLTKCIWLENMIQSESNNDFEKLLEYVQTNLTEKLTVFGLCRKFNVSKNALYQYFRVHFDRTVNEHIRYLRLTQAEHLLKTTNLSIYEICEIVGIDNYHYFCRMFKKEKSITALQYRKQYLQKYGTK